MTEFLGLRRLDHIGLTVPDLDAAVDFFCNAFGFELLYAHGPYGDAESEWAEREFELHPRSIAERIAMLRLGALQLELFEWSSPDQDLRFPKATDAGGYHLAFYVDDVPAAVRHLRDNGAAVIGTVKLLPGPEAGDDGVFIFTEAPWGLGIELISYPHGKAYENPGYVAAPQGLTAPPSAGGDSTKP